MKVNGTKMDTNLELVGTFSIGCRSGKGFCTKDSTKTIKAMVLGAVFGQMASIILANGKTVSLMAKVSSCGLLDKLKKECTKMVNSKTICSPKQTQWD